MQTFHFPKTVHVRRFKPKQFKRYQSFKRFLQHEFARTCVYCRQPDSAAPGLIFGVDHYRPKSRPEFAALKCEYTNLFYCCPACNSRKSDYWPSAGQPRIVNPCDDAMANHLKLDAATGQVISSTDEGARMIELLQLNDPDVVDHRRTTLAAIRYIQKNLDQIEIDRVDLKKRLVGGADESDVLQSLEELDQDEALLVSHIARLTGTTPLPALPRRSHA